MFQCAGFFLLAAGIQYFSHFFPHLVPTTTFFSDTFYRYRANSIFSEQYRSDTVLVTFDEKFIRSLPYRSPVDRCILSALIEQLSAYHPKVVGVDLIFDQDTEVGKDQQLKATLLKHQEQLILASQPVTDSRLYVPLIYQSGDFVPTTLQASALLIKDHDGVVRYALLNDHERPTFAYAVANRFKPLAMPASETLEPFIIDWLPNTSSGREILPKLPVSSFMSEAIAQACNTPNLSITTTPAYYRTLLQDKIVLIGVDLELEDRHRTVFDSSKNVRPVLSGVEIHAHIIQQLVDKRVVKVLPEWLSIFVLALSLVIGSALHCRKREQVKVYVQMLQSFGKFLLISLLICIIEYSALRYYSYALPAGLLFWAWLGFGLVYGRTLIHFIKGQ